MNGWTPARMNNSARQPFLGMARNRIGLDPKQFVLPWLAATVGRLGALISVLGKLTSNTNTQLPRMEMDPLSAKETG